MSEHDPIDPEARALFEAARLERPDERVRARTKALATSALRGIHDVEARGNARSLAPLAWSVVCAAALGIAWLVAAREPERASTFAITPEPNGPPERSKAAARERVAPQPALAPERAGEERRAPRPKLAPKSPAPETRASSAPEPAPSLAAELELLDRAREALASHDAARTIALVERYERELGGTRMRAEADLLRIEALAQSGDRARAQDLAKRFVAEHAGNPLAERARTFLKPEDTSQGEP